jgi:hypothetical protein
MNDNIRNACQYISNTGESVTAAQFDDDNDPIGPLLRRDIMPKYVTEVGGILKLTDEGRKAIS